MKNILILGLIVLHFSLNAVMPEKKNYALERQPIDAVIVVHPKDKETLNGCIEGIKKNCADVRRIIVVSSEPLSDQSEWFDEKLYPFSLEDVKRAIGGVDEVQSEKYFKRHGRPPGWYLQQLLKLYAPFVIPDISSNVLVVDADTVFLNPVKFTNDANGGLFCVSYREAKKRYLRHAERLVPGYERVYPEFYSVCHHMLFQKPILDDLFNTVEEHHQMPFWKAFCSLVNIKVRKKNASEYEIYYNFALRHTDQVEIRELKWANSGETNKQDQFEKEGYHFVSFHTYLRK